MRGSKLLPLRLYVLFGGLFVQQTCEFTNSSLGFAQCAVVMWLAGDLKHCKSSGAITPMESALNLIQS